MAGPNLDPIAVAGVPLGDDAGGNTEQPVAEPAAATGGMSTENAGALTGSAGLAVVKKSAKKAVAK